MKKATPKPTKAWNRSPQIGTPVLVRMQPDPLAALDDWRRKQADTPTRAEAIRRLVDLGMRVKKR
jgi:hypothetical protein